MTQSPILHMFGLAVLVLTVAMLLPVIASIGAGDWTTALVFAVSALVNCFLGGALVLGFRNRGSSFSRVGAIMMVTMIWVLLPVCAALPLFLALPEMRAVAAIFEMVSGLTTTGATAITGLDEVPRGIVLWRSVVQWLGGILTLLTAFLILTPTGVTGLPAQIFLPGYERDHLLRSVIATSRAIAPAYGGLTFFCMVGLWLSGVPGFDAICLALSTVSTGGFLPVDGTISQYGNASAEFVLSVFMLLGALSFVAHYAHVARVRGGHHETTESHHMIMLIIAAVVVLTVIFWGGFVEVHRLGSLEALRIGLFRAISLLSTTGYDNAPLTAPAVPFVVAMTLTAIGGCAYSTAGGLKVYRFAMLWRQAGRELVRLVHPHGITTAKAAGRLVNIQLMTSVWVMFAVYISTAAIVAMMLALDGVRFETALMAGVSALSNAGPTINMTAGPSASLIYPVLSDVSLVTVSIAMILGRLELLVVLSLASAIYWRT